MLIIGNSGIGKSTLCLSLLGLGLQNPDKQTIKLIGDDRIDLLRQDHLLVPSLIASAPSILFGMIEIRGFGITKLTKAQIAPATAVSLVIGLENNLPQHHFARHFENDNKAHYKEYLGVRLPYIRLPSIYCHNPNFILMAVTNFFNLQAL